jgi:hypothetical protein
LISIEITQKSSKNQLFQLVLTDDKSFQNIEKNIFSHWNKHALCPFAAQTRHGNYAASLDTNTHSQIDDNT